MPALASLRTPAPIASNDAPTHTTEAAALHMAACNALSQALHTLRHGDLTPEALARAISRARRGLTNLKRMAALEGAAA